MKALALFFFISTAAAQEIDYTGQAMSGGAAFTASLIVHDTPNGLQLVSYDVQLGGQEFASLANYGGQYMTDGTGVFTGYGKGGPYYDQIRVLQSNGMVTGAVLTFTDNIYHGGNSDWTLGGASDSYSVWAADCYDGATCAQNVSNTQGGVWTVKSASTAAAIAAPEVDPQSAFLAALLLVGGLAVVMGRRQHG